MSKQLANLAGSTLVSDYRPGSGAITVESVARFPMAPFTAAIVDCETEEFKLWFRVTSVSDTIFSGSAEGEDVAANVGDLVLAPEIRHFEKKFVFTRKF